MHYAVPGEGEERGENGKLDLIPCMGCNYCAKACPQNADIMFGRHVQERANWGSGRNLPGVCIECYSCETACPQGISIVEELKRVAVVIG